MVMKAVQKDKSAAAVKERKVAKARRRKTKHKINREARAKYKAMTVQEKRDLHAQAVFTKAMRHGATEAEAKKIKAAWLKRRKLREQGQHAAGKRRDAHSAQRQIRSQLSRKADALSTQHKKALQAIKTKGKTPAARAQLRAKEKARYADARKALAAERMKATGAHKAALKKIKSKGKFSLKSMISNYKEKPISTQGKRLVNVDKIGKKAQADGIAKIAQRFDAKKIKTGGAKKKTPAAVAPAAAEAPVKKGRGRPKMTDEQKKAAAEKRAAAKAPATPAKKAESKKADKPAKAPAKKPSAKKTEAAPAAPEKRGRGRPKMTEEQKAAAKLARDAKKASAAKPAKASKAPKAPKASTKTKPSAKSNVEAKEKPENKKPAAKTKPSNAPAKKQPATKPAAKPAAKKPAKKPAAEAKAPGKQKTGGAAPKVRLA